MARMSQSDAILSTRWPAAVIMERQALNNRWASEKWEAKGVVPDLDPSAEPRVILEVRVRHHVDPVALALGPLQERQLPVRPPGRARPRRQLVEPQVAHVRGHLRIRGVDHRDATPGTGRLVEEARRHRPLQRRPRRAGVEVQPAEVVVGVQRVGGQLQQDRVRRIGRRAEHEERVVAASAAAVSGPLPRDVFPVRRKLAKPWP